MLQLFTGTFLTFRNLIHERIVIRKKIRQFHDWNTTVYIIYWQRKWKYLTGRKRQNAAELVCLQNAIR